MKKYYEITDNSVAAMIRGKRVRHVKANESISLEARACETVAIVGESGCGKSTFAKVLMGLETATDGEVLFNGKDIAQDQVQKRSPEQVGAMQMVFQNPFDTLNPSHTRSEEHTSELQSLMRISYAVFCLKKKHITTSHLTNMECN